MARSAALLLILRQPPPAKRVNGRDSLSLTAVFPVRISSRATDPNPTRHGRMGETKTATPFRRRGLVHACRIVIQTQRKRALDLRDARAIAPGVIPRFLSSARNPRSTLWHPDHRHHDEPYAKQTNDPHEYPTFGFHFRPPLLNRHPPEDPVSRLRLPLWQSLGKTEPSRWQGNRISISFAISRVLDSSGS